MKRICVGLTAMAMSGGFCLGQTKFDSVPAKLMIGGAGHLYVAQPKGGIAIFDATTTHLEREIPTTRPVHTMRLIDGRLCWVVTDSNAVSFANADGTNEQCAEVHTMFLHTPIQRISGWMGKIMIQGDAEIAFIEPQTRVTYRPEDCLPADVCKIAKQGIVDSYNENGTNMFLSIRRYGSHRGVIEPGSIRQIGMITAWTTGPSNSMKLLSSYTSSVVDFRDAEGPDTEFQIRNQLVKNRFGMGETGNISLGKDGILALANRNVIAVPFLKAGWTPDHIKAAFHPSYAQNAAYSSGGVWWSKEGHVFRVDLEDGSTEAFTPNARFGRITSITPDDSGAWVASTSGIRRIELENLDGNWHRVAASGNTEPNTHEQYQLLKAIAATKVPGRGAYAPANALDELLTKSGAKPGQLTASESGVDEAELGDVVSVDHRLGVYLGGGEVVYAEAGAWHSTTLSADSEPRFYRVLPRSIPTYDDLNPAPPIMVKPKPGVVRPPIQVPPMPTEPRRYFSVPTEQESTWTGPRANESDIFPRGINRPKSSLGHSLFVRCAPGEMFDVPHLPTHHRLLEIAKSWLGTPYVWGGNTKRGVDCSGFVKAVYDAIGIHLPRYSQDMGRVRFGTVVKEKLHFGDILVFQSPHHVALYIGNGRTIEAVSGGVGYSSVYRRTQAIVRRFLF